MFELEKHDRQIGGKAMNYVIVKYAGENWEYHWEKDPRLGCHVDCITSSSYTGKQVGVKPVYTDLEEARKACVRRNDPADIRGVCEWCAETILKLNKKNMIDITWKDAAAYIRRLRTLGLCRADADNCNSPHGKFHLNRRKLWLL